MPIDGIVFMWEGMKQDLHRPRVIVGYCKVDKKGPVNVALNVGNCPNYGDADAYTGWQSSTRIIIEEIEPPQ